MLQGSNQVISGVLRACPSVRGGIAWDWISGFVFFRHILRHPLATLFLSRRHNPHGEMPNTVQSVNLTMR